MGQNKEKRYYNEKKKSVDEVFFCINLQKNAKICKRLSMSYPWIMQKMQKICKKLIHRLSMDDNP